MYIGKEHLLKARKQFAITGSSQTGCQCMVTICGRKLHPSPQVSTVDGTVLK